MSMQTGIRLWHFCSLNNLNLAGLAVDGVGKGLGILSIL